MRLQEGFLGHILGQVRVAQSRVSCRESEILVPPDELSECVDVTALGGSYDVRQLGHKDHFYRPSPGRGAEVTVISSARAANRRRTGR
jgi:hypothetical protein